MKELTLGNSLASLIDHRGKTPKKLGADFTDSGVPVISAKLVNDGTIDFASARFVDEATWKRWMPVRLQRNDVILTSEAPLGRTTQIQTNDPVVLGQRLFALRGAEGILDSTFLRYWLDSPRGQASLVSMASGTTVVGIRQELLLKLKLVAPTFEEQQAIGHVLSSLDDKIAANLAVVQHANALATSFVAARNGELSRASLKELTTLVSRGITPRYDDTGGYMVLNQRCIRDSQVNIALSRTMKSLPKNREKVLRQHDVLINSTGQGTLGRIARWISTAPDTSVDTHVSIVRFNPDLADPAFAGTVLATMQRQVEDLAEGSTGQTELKRDLLAGLELNLPPLEKQREVGNQLRLLDDLCQARLEENQVLAKTRDELLPLLMSGKITVREAGQEAAAARTQVPSKENEV